MKLILFLTGFGFTVFLSNAWMCFQARRNVQARLAIIGLSCILLAILLAAIKK